MDRREVRVKKKELRDTHRNITEGKHNNLRFEGEGTFGGKVSTRIALESCLASSQLHFG